MCLSACLYNIIAVAKGNFSSDSYNNFPTEEISSR